MSRRKDIDRSSYISGYPKKMKDGNLALTDWQGNILGYGRVISSSKIPHGARGSWISDRRVSYNFVIDGKRYHGRGYGEGMLLNLRPFKASV